MIYHPVKYIAEPMTLQGHLDQFNSIYYILWCIENILLKSKQDESLRSSKDLIMPIIISLSLV